MYHKLAVTHFTIEVVDVRLQRRDGQDCCWTLIDFMQWIGFSWVMPRNPPMMYYKNVLSQQCSMCYENFKWTHWTIQQCIYFRRCSALELSRLISRLILGSLQRNSDLFNRVGNLRPGYQRCEAFQRCFQVGDRQFEIVGLATPLAKATLYNISHHNIQWNAPAHTYLCPWRLTLAAGQTGPG